MSSSKFLAMLLLFAGLLYLAFEKNSQNEDLQNSNDNAPRALIHTRDLAKVQISFSDNQQSAKLSFADDQWRLTDFPKSKLDNKSVKSFFDALSALDDGDKIDTSSESYGLEQPVLVIELIGKDGKEQKISFGNKNKISNRRYSRVSDLENVFMIDEGLYADLYKNQYAFRDKTPFNFEAHEPTKLIIRKGKFDLVTLRKDQYGKYIYQSPVQKVSIDKDLIEDILRDIINIHVEEFIDQPGSNFKEYGLDPEKITIGIDFGAAITGGSYSRGTELDLSPDSLVLYFGEVDQEDTNTRNFYFQVKGLQTVYRYNRAPYHDFFQDISLLRDRTPFNEVTPDKVKSIRLKVEGEEKKLREEDRNKLIDAILGLRVLTYLSPTSKEIDEVFADGTALEVAFEVASSTEEFSLRVGKGVGSLSKTGVSESDAPRFSLIQSTDGGEIPAVISSTTWEALGKFQ